MIEDLAKEVTRVNALYVQTSQEFNSYADRDLNESEQQKIYQCIAKMNMVQSQLQPVYEFITTHAKFAQESMQQWNAFVEKLNKEMESPETKIIN